MNRCELAYQYHKKGYNCAQSVMMGELCGALTGAIMVLDLLTQTDTENAVEAKKRAMAQAKELQKRFSERFDALRCAELLKKKFIPDDTTPSAKVLQLTGHCDIMIVTAVEIVEEMLQELKGGALPDHIQS